MYRVVASSHWKQTSAAALVAHVLATVLGTLRQKMLDYRSLASIKSRHILDQRNLKYLTDKLSAEKYWKYDSTFVGKLIRVVERFEIPLYYHSIIEINFKFEIILNSSRKVSKICGSTFQIRIIPVMVEFEGRNSIRQGTRPFFHVVWVHYRWASVILWDIMTASFKLVMLLN